MCPGTMKVSKPKSKKKLVGSKTSATPAVSPPSTPATSSSDVSTERPPPSPPQATSRASTRPRLPRQPSSGDVDNDAILQAMTASEKKAKTGGTVSESSKISATTKSPSNKTSTSTSTGSGSFKTSQLKPPPPGSMNKSSSLSSSSSSLNVSYSSIGKEKKPKKTRNGSTRETTKFAQSSTASLMSAAASSAAATAAATGGSTVDRQRKSLREMETDVTEKAVRATKPGTTTTPASSPAAAAAAAQSSSDDDEVVEVRPGAYSIQGSTVARASAGTLTKNEQQRIGTSTLSLTSSPRPSPPSASATPSAGAVGDDIDGNNVTKKKKKSGSRSKKKIGGIVVAAELTEDVEQMLERKIEEEVRKRILAQAAKADIVAVDHGVSKRQILPEEEEARRIADLKKIHKPKGVREKLFGDKRQTVDVAASPECIRKRDYLQWTVKRNPTTGQWVASVMTNQKAMENGNNLEAELTKVSYTATTQEEAYETGLANAVPLMQPFEDNPICSVCKAKFALFRRPCHCRNCGACICSNCTTTWPSKMFPTTFVRKNDKSILSVCIACDWVQSSFREALLTGNRQAAEDLCATGNVNIRSPFCLEKNGEHPYPIHLAILGGNLNLIRWMVEIRYVPLHMIQIEKNGRKSVEKPILTSHGRSPMAIALLHQRLDIVHYLIVDLNLSFFAEENLNTGVALTNFTMLLKMLPADFLRRQNAQNSSLQQSFSFAPSSDLSE